VGKIVLFGVEEFRLKALSLKLMGFLDEALHLKGVLKNELRK
tara:strand:+ start:8138 stop:8263 length:126 start_codon:yes stop_codon:yes gene_type:complete